MLVFLSYLIQDHQQDQEPMTLNIHEFKTIIISSRICFSTEQLVNISDFENKN